jgi:alkanesulfonate monooxygenase
MNLRFHWMLPKGGEVSLNGPQTPREAANYRLASTRAGSPAPRPDIPGWTHFGKHAEAAGIDSVLISFSRYEPDPILVAAALGQTTTKLRFIAAYRSGLMKPATFVQQINTVSAFLPGRVSINIVAGSSTAEQRGYGDYLAHDERYARTDEFLAVCHSFWKGNGDVNFDGKYYQVDQGKLHTPFVAAERGVPEIYISGHSEQAEQLALSKATCLLRVADTPERLRSAVARVRERGIEVCLRMCVISRPTRQEAVEVAESLLPDSDLGQYERSVAVKNDSQMYREASQVENRWLSRSLWTGFVPYYGPVWTTLLGSFDDVTRALVEYKEIGVTQFIMSGWPELDEVINFGNEVVPRVRRAEEQATFSTQRRKDAKEN